MEVKNLKSKKSHKTLYFNLLLFIILIGQLFVLAICVFLFDAWIPTPQNEIKQDLRQAIEYNDIEYVRETLSKYPLLANKNLNGFSFFSLMHDENFFIEAVKTGNLEMVKLFVESGADVNNRYYTTPLIAAVRGGYNDIAEYLINMGANKDSLDKSENTALDYARDASNEYLIDLLTE